MATGSLLYPVGYAPTNDGAVVPSGRLYFYRTGTSTAQDTYSDSTLQTANDNPVVLNSEGYLDTKVYGDPASGYDYRVKLTDSAAVQIWQVDDVVVDGADTATISEGSFTGTLTGMDAATTGTVSYKIVANSSGTGKVCTLLAASAITGTSDADTMTMTGLPAACTPSTAVRVLCEVHENTTAQLGLAVIAASGTTITFSTDLPFSASGFTASGAKGLSAGWQISYLL